MIPLKWLAGDPLKDNNKIYKTNPYFSRNICIGFLTPNFKFIENKFTIICQYIGVYIGLYTHKQINRYALLDLKTR